MRKFLIDTDTASDDAVALIMALREKDIRVEAITVVAGNVPIDTAVKNALISIEVAESYQPPVYRGAGKPLMRELFTSEFVHGDDGMGNMDLPSPKIKESEGHAVDMIIDIIMENPHEIELITLGPLTNIALAVAKEPGIAEMVKSVTVMGGAGLGPGNVTPVAEYNIYVDAEAAHMVLNSGMPLQFVGWDVSTDETFIDKDDIQYMLNSGSKIAKFCVRCNDILKEWNLRYNKEGFDLPDPTAVAAAIYPEVVSESFEAFASIEYTSEKTYGQLLIDIDHTLNKAPNAKFCKKLDAIKFKKIMFDLIC